MTISFLGECQSTTLRCVSSFDPQPHSHRVDRSGNIALKIEVYFKVTLLTSCKTVLVVYTLANFTQCAMCMTYKCLETSLPM